MKVVLLAGGLGTRMREETEFKPKPMVEIGGKPVLWHIMKIFASYGHTEFVICAGYKAEFIREYFYSFGARNMDFTLRLGDPDSAIFHGSHVEFDWTVTVADTGLDTPTGGRIKRIERYLNGESFFCTYGDGLAPVDLDALLSAHLESGRTATMTVTKPSSRFGVVEIDAGNKVKSFQEKPTLEGFINIGYFLFNTEVFEHLADDSVLEDDSLRSLAASNSLNAHRHEGFWQPMDTYRESLAFNQLWHSERPPWKTWD